ncbi:MAG: 50S ribosomal protein L9 [Armatimonadetes bacterium]|nr:50S ribosomal protein L9 [Armatimonadota bacterium]
MKVILTKPVAKLGKDGSVVNVKAGYARNYLFPQGMAVYADKAQLNLLENRNAKMAAQLAETKVAAEALAEKVNGKELKIETKAGDAGRLFGAITSQNIVDELKNQLGIDFEKKDVLLVAPIKRAGIHDVELYAHREVHIEVKVNVFDPEQIEAERKAAAQARGEETEEAPVAEAAPVVEEAPAEEAAESSEESAE